MSESPRHPFYGSVRKTDRAIAHIHALKGEMETFFDEEPAAFRAISKVDMESSRYLLRVMIDRPFPDWWGLIVGDVVQNLRAALDQFVCQMVHAKGKEPDRHAFPIFTAPPAEGTQAARTWNRMLAGLDPEAVAFIERCQPYHGPNGPRGHTLFALRELSNEDKHRLLLPAVGAIRVPEPGFDFEVTSQRDVGAITGGKLHAGHALKHGDLVAEATVEITGLNPEIKTNADLKLNIGFGREPIVPIKGLLQMLDSVRATVHAAAVDLIGHSDPVIEAELDQLLGDAPE